MRSEIVSGPTAPAEPPLERASGGSSGVAEPDQSGVGSAGAPSALIEPGRSTEEGGPGRSYPQTGGISGWRVAVTDDAINAGTAVCACAAELRSQAAELVAVGALLALGPAANAIGVELSVPFYTVDTIASQAWPADDCPLCASGIPLTQP